MSIHDQQHSATIRQRAAQVARPLDGSAEAAHTAAVVNELSAEMQKVLAGHAVNEQRRAEGKNPANLVLLRGCGSRCPFMSRCQLHTSDVHIASQTPLPMRNTLPEAGRAGSLLRCTVEGSRSLEAQMTSVSRELVLHTSNRLQRPVHPM